MFLIAAVFPGCLKQTYQANTFQWLCLQAMICVASLSICLNYSWWKTLQLWDVLSLNTTHSIQVQYQTWPTEWVLVCIDAIDSGMLQFVNNNTLKQYHNVDKWLKYVSMSYWHLGFHIFAQYTIVFSFLLKPIYLRSIKHSGIHW